MVPQILASPSETETSPDNETVHIVCQFCFPVVAPGTPAMCGLVQDWDQESDLDAEPECLVCADIAAQTCPGCGL